ncbi:MAG TPA: patatin-like phospholipase family protein [Firmicutes bacterium]|nr:patatin-like phospholipase family protein [Bacillota bacterium]
MRAGRKKVGLALGGGSARGFAHIGVLKVLEEDGISAEIVAGSSMGAVVGSLYCAGVPLSVMERLATSTYSRRSLWTDWTFPHMGLLAGDRLEQLLLLLTRRKTFQALDRCFAAVACDLCNGKKVVIRDGVVARAVRASAAIPGIFRPVEDGEKVLVDGSVVERVPAPTARELGADIVIAVDVGLYLTNQKPQHLLDVISQSLDVLQRDLCRYTLDEADIIIRPELQEIAPGHFHRAAEAIRAGEEAARKELPHIRKILCGKEHHAQVT